MTFTVNLNVKVYDVYGDLIPNKVGYQVGISSLSLFFLFDIVIIITICKRPRLLKEKQTKIYNEKREPYLPQNSGSYWPYPFLFGLMTL